MSSIRSTTSCGVGKNGARYSCSSAWQRIIAGRPAPVSIEKFPMAERCRLSVERTGVVQQIPNRRALNQKASAIFADADTAVVIDIALPANGRQQAFAFF